MRNPAGPRCSPLAPPWAPWGFLEHLPTRTGERSLKISSPRTEQPRLVSDAAQRRFPALIPRGLKCGISFRPLHPPRHRQRWRTPQTCSATSSSQRLLPHPSCKLKLPAARAILSPNFLCLVSDLLQQREVKLHRRHSGSYKQRPARREKRVLNPKCTEISGEMGWKGGKGKMQSEEIMGKEDVEGRAGSLGSCVKSQGN